MTQLPERITRSRAKDWRMPENTVYVGRGSVFGNPFKLSELAGFMDTQSTTARQFVIDQYECYLSQNPRVVDRIKRELRGKNLACWCKPDQLCHADLLIKIANEGESHPQPLPEGGE